MSLFIVSSLDKFQAFVDLCYSSLLGGLSGIEKILNYFFNRHAGRISRSNSFSVLSRASEEVDSFDFHFLCFRCTELNFSHNHSY